MKDSTEQAMIDLEYCIARYGRKDSFTLAAYDALDAMKKMRARIAELEKDAEIGAVARKSAALLSDSPVSFLKTMQRTIDTAMQGA